MAEPARVVPAEPPIEEAFATAAAEHLPALWISALRLTGNRTDAGTLVEETYRKANAGFGRMRLRDQGDLEAWLDRLLLNTYRHLANNPAKRDRHLPDQTNPLFENTGLQRTIDALDSFLRSKQMEQQPEPPLEATTERPPRVILGKLGLVLAEVDRLQEEAKQLVLDARQQGVTWAQIGEVAGVKPQSAYQRWTETGRQKHRERQRKRYESE